MNNRRLLSSAGYVALIACGMITVASGAILPRLTATFGVAETEGGFLMTAFAIGLLVGTFQVGRSVNLKPLLLIGGGLMATTVALLPLSAAWWQVQLLTFVGGISSALMNVGSHAVTAIAYPEARGKALTLLNIFFGIGALAQPLLARSLPLWQQTYWAILPVVLLFLGLMARAEVPRGGEAGDQASFKPGLMLILAVAAITTYVGGEASVMTWIVAYLEGVAGWTATQAPLALSLFWLALAVGRLISALVVERVGYIKTLIGCSLGAGLFVLVGLILPGSPIWVWGLVGLCMAPIYPVVVAVATQAYPMAASAVTSILAAAGGIGIMLTPPLVGRLSAARGFTVGLGLVPVLMVGVALLSLAAGQRLKAEG